RDRAGARDPRVELAEIDLVRVEIYQHVHLEESLIALGAKPIAEAAHEFDAARTMGVGERIRKQVVPAPAALVRRELGITGEIGHERADDRAMLGDHGLYRSGLVVDPLHDLEIL